MNIVVMGVDKVGIYSLRNNFVPLEEEYLRPVVSDYLQNLVNGVYERCKSKDIKNGMKYVVELVQKNGWIDDPIINNGIMYIPLDTDDDLFIGMRMHWGELEPLTQKDWK